MTGSADSLLHALSDSVIQEALVNSSSLVALNPLRNGLQFSHSGQPIQEMIQAQQPRPSSKTKRERSVLDKRVALAIFQEVFRAIVIT